MSELTLYRGEVFDFIDSPLNRKDAYRYFPDGALVVREGEIVDCGPFEEIKGRYTDYELVDYSGKLLMPGFIDSHIHYPQAEIIGMYGRQLLDWLEDYTFPAEQAFVSSEHADRMAHFSCRGTIPERNDSLHGLCNGTSNIRHRSLLRCVGI